ncbi:hypothetical protein HUU05_13095, partial [candidate division KSB1 bacterium]|nr:hypothetical protein [candidate division KSB1 bacterium]
LEQSNDFIEWLGVYEIKLKRERKYQQCLAEMLGKQSAPVQLPLKESVPA